MPIIPIAITPVNSEVKSTAPSFTPAASPHVEASITTKITVRTTSPRSHSSILGFLCAMARYITIAWSPASPHTGIMMKDE
ncbi:hypothetical protein ACFLWG_00165 [Chloroflexota bacterium]